MKLIGIGIDIVKIDRFIRNDEKFLKKIFTKKEIEYCSKKRNPSQHFAVRFAAKEAIKKAIGKEGQKIEFKNIKIISNINDKPTVEISNGSYQKMNWQISLSHDKDTAVAVAILLK